MKLFQIKHRITGAVLFSLECGSLKICIEAAVEQKVSLDYARLDYASLDGASLDGARLDGASLDYARLDYARLDYASLVGARLDYASLDGASLDGASLVCARLDGASLDGASLATDDQAIANLDKVREIILGDDTRLDMGIWHDAESWKDRTCAEEAVCGTTHCLAGWLQVCATDPEVRKLDPQTAGIVQAPVAAKMFFSSNTKVTAWLESRAYVQDIEEWNKRIAEVKAKLPA